MFEFLGQIGNIADKINKVASPVSQIMGIFGKKGSPQQSLRDQIISQSTNRPQSAAERQAIALLSALAEPNSPLLKSLTDQEFRAGTEAMQGDIRSRVLADRREQSMGRAPVFFDPERADENIAFQLSRGGPGMRAMAEQNAINRILKAAGVGGYAANADARFQNNLNSMASVYAMDTLHPGQRGEQSDQQMQTQLPGGLGKLQTGLTSLDQILQTFGKPAVKRSAPMGPFPMTQNTNTGTVRWNQMRY